MTDFQQQLIDLLLTDDRIKSEYGELLKSEVRELARKNDSDLIRLLLSDQQIKSDFFIDVDGILIFDKDRFIRIISSKQFLPDSFTTFKNKIGLAVGDEYIDEANDVVLIWPYRECVLDPIADSVDETQVSVLYNETINPEQITKLLDAKAFSKFTRHSRSGLEPLTEFIRDENGVIRDNLIIKGNNLLALHSIKKQFSGKVNLIYIDTPYTTDTDPFIYQDNFKHSTWLTFMKNRLEIAKDLLAEDGSIYVHVGTQEAHYCKVLMDEIFQTENFQREIIWRMGGISGYRTMDNNWIRNHDTILFYTKKPDKFTFNKEFLKYPEDYDQPESEDDEQGLALEDVWGVRRDEGINSWTKLHLSKEYLGFWRRKPESLLKRIIEVSSNEGDIVMDFFMGAGTTLAVAHKLRRQYIGIDQIDYGQSDCLLRLDRVIKGEQTGISKEVNWGGGGEFVYMELAKSNQLWIEKLESAYTTPDFIQLFKEMSEEAFLSYKIDPNLFVENIDGFSDLIMSEKRMILHECLDKNHLYINLSELEDADYGLTEEEKRLNREFYG